MIENLRCRYTGRVEQGPFTLADDADIDWDDNECPECGASGADECTTEDGEALGRWIHSAREAT